MQQAEIVARIRANGGSYRYSARDVGGLCAFFGVPKSKRNDLYGHLKALVETGVLSKEDSDADGKRYVIGSREKKIPLPRQIEYKII